jgi:hypothetical protein
MRSDTVLHAIPMHRWSEDELLSHSEETFRRAVVEHPDLMEPYVIRLEGELAPGRIAIVREALASTFTRRHLGRYARLTQRLSSGAA